jgi:protein-tyrosine kinase
MSRVADALARAGAKRTVGTAPTDAAPADLFPTESGAPQPVAAPEVEFQPEPEVRPVRPAPVPPSSGRSQTVQRPESGSRWTSEPAIRYRNAFREDLIEKLAIENGAEGAVVEEFRKLAATLHHAQGVHRLKVVMVTSAAGGEGKSLTTVNLALTLSNSYRRRVLLIDADLRKPTIHDIFQVQNSAGLLSFLKNGPDRSVPGIEVSPRLIVMPSGGVSADPIGLLTSSALRELLDEASRAFDWVLIDTPPAAILPDCNLLAPAVDGVLLIVDAFHTPHPMAVKAIEAVGRDKILGVVLNHAEHTQSNYKYGKGY